MTLEELLLEIDRLAESAPEAIDKASYYEEVEIIRNSLIGRKIGQ